MKVWLSNHSSLQILNETLTHRMTCCQLITSLSPPQTWNKTISIAFKFNTCDCVPLLENKNQFCRTANGENREDILIDSVEISKQQNTITTSWKTHLFFFFSSTSNVINSSRLLIIYLHKVKMVNRYRFNLNTRLALNNKFSFNRLAGNYFFRFYCYIYFAH